ncbi:unnamed protein product [Brassicogethes aeneus]|uniref:Uncharacterized protein n=1 Tax=Brassicogethes aeneus TaxID=1431903 RepID=A0A9P0AXV5_BRAAE|nr:unnamed protein product [Brassicogethes aeneus]
MVQKDELYKRHRDLCGQLNLEEHIIQSSWDKFQNIQKNFSLEDDIMHWLGCAIFEACQSTETTTMDHSVVRGNCLNFTSLLRHSNLSFVKFFLNMNNWIEMAKLSNEFKEQISHLKSTFGVAYNTFKEFKQIFNQIFITPDPQELDQSKTHRNRKQRPLSCTSAKVFEFIWNLFNTIKMGEPNYGSDLTKSFHVLYACIDLAFKNAFVSDRRDILRPTFVGLPEDWTNPGFEMPPEAPCIIKLLCKCENLLTEAMHIKTYRFRDHLNKLLADDVLVGANDYFLGIFEPGVFEQNSKNITKAYDMQLLSKGGFDERIFMAEYRRQLLELQQQTPVYRTYKAHMSEQADFSVLESPKVQRGIFQTPLTGRRFLPPKEHENEVTDTSQTIIYLQNILSGTRTGPSDKLLQLFESCTENPADIIKQMTNNMGITFTNAYKHKNLTEEDIENRLQMAIKLFYKLIESILSNEQTIQGNLSAIVVNEGFYKLTFACSLEIVTFVHDNQQNFNREFPWMLTIFDIKPYHFLKVIELIVRTKELSPRDIIKHLSKAEETILESLAWSSESVLWDFIGVAGAIPRFVETARPDQISNETTHHTGAVHSASEEFQSPISNHVSRQLFPTVSAGQSVLNKHTTHLIFTDSNGQNRLIPLIEQDHSEQQVVAPEEKAKTPEVYPPRKTGSLAIFFRKFYYLVGERLHHLCIHLDKLDLKPKIWTIFEDSIIKHTYLMKNRHLDQLLMCAVYVIAKVSQDSIKFTEVMKCYRGQPQATSDIYRNVLLGTTTRQNEDGTVEEKEQRGDLISFYNSTYVNEMKEEAQKFAPLNRKLNIHMSPLPAVKRNVFTSKVQVVGNVFVKPFESPNAGRSRESGFNHYYFNRSPSKELQNINRAINGVIAGKRLLSGDDGELPATKKTSSYRKIQSLVEERKSQNLQ